MWELPGLSTKVQNSHLSHVALFLFLSLFLICFVRPAVSNHSLSVTLNLICKCDVWGPSPVLCAPQPHTLQLQLQLSTDPSECHYFSSFCSVTPGNRPSANSKLSHRPQTLPVNSQNKPHKRDFTKTKGRNIFVNLQRWQTVMATKAFQLNSSHCTCPVIGPQCENSPWNVANIRNTIMHVILKGIDWRRSQKPSNNDSRGQRSGMSNIWHFKTEKLRS